MSLCRLMQDDFLHSTGRFDEAGVELYSDDDLHFGAEYARGWIEQGIMADPVGEFDLEEFAAWCGQQEDSP